MPSPSPASPPAVVLDTNFVLDWLLFDNPASKPIATALESGRLRWIASSSMRREFAHVAARPVASVRGHSPASLLAGWDRWANEHEDPAPGPPDLRCRDASDQPFLDLAMAARARWLVTRDRALLALARRASRRGLQILVPERWPGQP